ncbi:MAG: hypothetical protein ACLSV2_02470 [Clostridium sp.]
MNRIKLSLNKLSNLLFYTGIFLGVIGYYRIYKVRANLPSGICPIDDNRGLIIVAAFMLISSVITSTLYERNLKRKRLKE